MDGSRYGQAAVRWAIKHRDLFGAEPRIELLHVVDSERTAAPPIEGLAYRARPFYGMAPTTMRSRHSSPRSWPAP